MDIMQAYVKSLDNKHPETTIAVLPRIAPQTTLAAITGDSITVSLNRSHVSQLRQILHIIDMQDPYSMTYNANLIYK